MSSFIHIGIGVNPKWASNKLTLCFLSRRRAPNLSPDAP